MTALFAKWFESLEDRRARARIQARIDRIEMGHFGDVAPVGEGVSECGFSMAPATGCISFGKEPLSSFFSQVATKALNKRTSPEPKK